MKTLYKGELRFVTPAFLSGADQNKPEIRVPSIRGELRWWFRAAGGSAEDEAEIFGGVHGDAVSSAVVIRVSEVKLKMQPEIKPRPMSDKSYLYYFAQVSGNDHGVKRTQTGHFIGVGSTFVLTVMSRRELPSEKMSMLKDSLGLFLRYGALGLRSTRGCGAFTAENAPEVSERVLGKFVIGRVVEGDFASGESCQEKLGGFLRALRKENHLSGKRQSALGYSNGNTRASSALKLRPIETADGRFAAYVVYTDAGCREGSLSELIAGKLI